MNFARHQDQAERTARRLLVLFALATLSVVLAVNAFATLLWQAFFAGLPFGFHATNTAVVLLLVIGGAWLETARLREDGARIVRRLGGVPVDTDADPMHRRLQNLLEELSIAARIGVPRAFVLPAEPSINALAAGLDRNHAVVAVTRGALDRLTRDELQGVLAHELSHVVNGDVRLNTRLVGLNHGLELVAMMGRSMLARAAGAGRPMRSGAAGLLVAVPFAAAGAVLAGVGSIGELAARAIRAGVGRQREYFADAQAIEFTRSLDGLGGALRKVAGLAAAARAAGGRGAAEAVLRHPYAPTVAHLLLIGPGAADGLFATHPPIDERLRRLYGAPVDPIVPRAPAAVDDAQRREPELPVIAFAPVGAVGDEPSPHAAQALDAASLQLVQATREAASAAALVVALIDDGPAAAPQWGEGWAVAQQRYEALRAAVTAMPADALRPLRWPLMELAVARLRPLSRPARESLLATARARIAADGRVTLREWIYFGLLRLRLAPPRAPRLPVLADPIDARTVRLLFALVAQAAQLNEARTERAANAAIRVLDGVPIGGVAGPLTLEALERAVQRAARLPPLSRPLLVRQLVAVLPPDADADVRDFLRLLCVAIDCPPPQFPARGRGRGTDAVQPVTGQPSTRHAPA